MPKRPRFKLVIDDKAYSYVVERSKATKTEIGFYMIGIMRENTGYVYDVIEFPYLDRSPVIVSSDPNKLGKILTALPLGLRVIGTLHKHPESLGTEYSSIDESTYINWSSAGFFIHAIFSNNGKKIAAYAVIDKKIRKAGVKIKDLSNEKLYSAVINIPLELRIFYHPNEKALDLLNRVERSILINIAKRILPLKLDNVSLESNVGRLDSIEIQNKAIIYVVPERHTYFPYEFAYPANLRFGDIRSEIITLLGLSEDTDFFTQYGKVYDTMKLSELHGKIIYPAKSLERLIEELVKNEVEKHIMKLSIDINTSMADLEEKIRDLVKSEVERFIKKIRKSEK